MSPISSAGWNATIGPARQSPNSPSGSNGGVAVATHSRWCSTAWPDTLDGRGHISPYCDLAGRTFRVDGRDIHVLVAYFDCHDGLGGRNAALLQRVEYRTGRGNDLFLLAADFNCPPDVLQDKAGEWLKRNKAVIARPHNLPITCRAGENGSLIDYFIVSESLVGCVTNVWTDATTPWGPHYGVWMRLHGRSSEIVARTLVKQRVRPAPMQGTAGSSPPTRHPLLRIRWRLIRTKMAARQARE